MKSIEQVKALRLNVGNIYVESYHESIKDNVSNIHLNLFLAAEWLGVTMKRMGESAKIRTRENPNVFNAFDTNDLGNLIRLLEDLEHEAGTIKTEGVQPVLVDDRLDISCQNAYIYIKNAKFQVLYILDRLILSEEVSELESRKRKSKEDKSRLEKILQWLGFN